MSKMPFIYTRVYPRFLGLRIYARMRIRLRRKILHYVLNFFFLILNFLKTVLPKVVPSGRQNTKYKTGRISCFVFCILSLDKTGPNDKIVSEFCLDFMFCRQTKKWDKIENTDFKPILSSVDHYDRERQKK